MIQKRLYKAGSQKESRVIAKSELERQNKEKLLIMSSFLEGKKRLFKAPILTEDLISAINLISPQLLLEQNEESRIFWELDQNGSCYLEYEALEVFLKGIGNPKKVLEIGPGLGRSVVFFKKQLDWQNVEFHLFEGSGTKTRYTLMGNRFNDSFCGNLEYLAEILEYNNTKNYKIFNADEYSFRLNNLPGPYDLIYSFYGVGFHWSLEHWFDEVTALMREKSLAIFTVPYNFSPFESLKTIEFSILKSIHPWAPHGEFLFLLLSKKKIYA